MKKITILFAMFFCIIAAKAQEWNFGNDPVNFPVNPIGLTSNTSTTINGLTIVAGSATQMGVVAAYTSSYDGVDYINRFRFSGAGWLGGTAAVTIPPSNMPTMRYVYFTVPGNVKITTVGITGSNAEQRLMFVTNGIDLLGTMTFPVVTVSGTLTKNSVNYIGTAARIYLFCNNTVHLMNLKVEPLTTPEVAVSAPGISGFYYQPGNGPSAEKTVNVSGIMLTNNISIDAPTNYEISTTSGAQFSPQSQIILTPTAGSIASTPIYVRLKSGLNNGNYNENLVVNSLGASSHTISLSGFVGNISETKTVNETVAGTLMTLISDYEKIAIKKLIVTGTFSWAEIGTIKQNLPALNVLDLSSANVSGNNIPANQFYSNTSLVLDSLILPNSLTVINQFSLRNCTGLKNIILGNSITNIETGGISICEGITNIKLGSNLSYMDGAFFGCSSLNTVYCLSIIPPILGSPEFSFAPLTKIFVPKSSVSLYKSANYWSDFSDIIFPYAVSLTSQATTNIDANTATLNGNIDIITDLAITAHGFCWNTTGNPTISDSKTDLGSKSGTGAFSSAISGLTTGVTYYVRAYATNSAGTVYGNEINFKTKSANISDYLTHQWTFDNGTANDNIGDAHGQLVGSASFSNKAVYTGSNGYVQLPADKIVINTYSEISTEAWFTSDLNMNPDFTVLSYFGGTAGDFGANYFLMTPARQDGISSTRISCGNTSSPWLSEEFVNGMKYDDGALHQMISTLGNGKISLYIDGTFIGSQSITNPANIISNLSNDMVCLAKGGYSTDPTWIGKIHKFSIYNAELNATDVLTLYGQGAEIQAIAAVVSTADASAISSNSATLNGAITSLGNSDVTAYGFCWNTTGMPTTTNDKTDKGACNATGFYSNDITGLTAGVTYYVRAYATNSAGTVYGNEIQFTSGLGLTGISTVTTSDISAISVVLHGEITSLGELPISTYGFCWNTSGTPTLANNKSDKGTRSTVIYYTDTISSLTPSTTYYVRAYATNSAGTVYGNEITFTTSAASSIKKVVYLTSNSRTMDATATTFENDPVIQVLRADPNLNVTVKLLAGTETLDDLGNYDVAVVQESFSSSAVILMPTGSLALKTIPIPVVYNKVFAFRTGKALTSSSATSYDYPALNLMIEPNAQTNDLFKGCTLNQNNEINIFNSTKNDYGAVGTKSLNYNIGNVLSGSSTLLAQPAGITGSSIAVNDIPAGTTIDSETLLSRMITLDMNYGALSADAGTNITSDGLTIWRNAVYILAGLPVPDSKVTLPDPNDPDITTGLSRLELEKQINIYPNPVKNELRVDFDGESRFEIINLMGQPVLEGNLINNSTINTEVLPSGVYLMKLIKGSTFSSKKFIKE